MTGLKFTNDVTGATDQVDVSAYYINNDNSVIPTDVTDYTY